MADKLDRRTKVYKDIIMMMPKADESIEETLDGQEYRYLPEPRCRVCTAGDSSKGLRNGPQVTSLVDSLLLYPKSVADVYRTIEPLMEAWPPKAKITYKSIRTHQHKHLAWDRLAMRMMVERWAQEKGISVLDAAGRMMLTQEAWLEMTAHLGWQRLISGDMEPSWAETQKAFEQMDEIKKQAEGEFSVAAMMAQMNTVIQIIREEVPPERWEYVVRKIENRADPEALPPPVEASADEFEEILNEQRKLGGDEE